MLWQTMYSYLESFFIYEGLRWDLMLLTIGLAFAFGAVWLCAHWIPLLRHPPLWLVMVGSAIITVLAITFVQIPLQYHSSQALTNSWDISALNDWLLLAGLPSVLISGLVQEGAKMIPVVAWWWRSGKKISPKLGLAIGAAAGAGFGVFEAVWGIGGTFLAGWSTDMISRYGFFLGISSFWERFFTVGFHTAVSALVGYGLAKGRGWQFYLIGSAIHALLSYSIVLYQYFTMVRGSGFITPTQIEIFVAAYAVIITAIVLWLRWRKDEGVILEEPAQPMVSEPVEAPAPVESAERPPDTGA